MHFLYAIGSYLAVAVLLPVLIFHPKLRHGIKERFGYYRSREAPGEGSPRIWLHGASAGDLLSLQPMMRELKERMPGCCLVVTTITNSGLEMARAKIREADVIVYAPYDLPGATRRALAALRPDLLVLEYTEIWPQPDPRGPQGRGAHRAHQRPVRPREALPVPDLLSRGREAAAVHHALPHALRRGGRARPPAGRPADRVWVTGNTKFDALVLDRPRGDDEELRAALGLDPSRPVFIAGSTHDGEEELLVDVYRKLLVDVPGLQMVVAPRYVERAGKIVAIAQGAGLTSRLRSAGASAGPAQVVVIDTIGELAAAYRLATLAFVGGSFIRRGGQNVLEPAGQGKPVLFGPHMESFKDSVQVLVGRGGIQVATPDQLLKVARELLSRPDEIVRLGAMAREAVSAVRGASARNVDHMLRALPRAKGPP